MMISKHMKAVGIEDWGDITRSNLYELRDEVEKELAPNSRRNFGAVLASFLRRYRDEVTLPDGWEDIIRFRGNKPVHAYLTKEELLSLIHI